MTHLTDEEILQASRGDQAAHELRETEAAFQQVRQGLFEVIATSKMGETDLRERCALAIQAVDKVKAILFEVASGRVVAEHSALIRGILEGRDDA